MRTKRHAGKPFNVGKFVSRPLIANSEGSRSLALEHKGIWRLFSWLYNFWLIIVDSSPSQTASPSPMVLPGDFPLSGMFPEVSLFVGGSEWHSKKKTYRNITKLISPFESDLGKWPQKKAARTKNSERVALNKGYCIYWDIEL